MVVIIADYLKNINQIFDHNVGPIEDGSSTFRLESAEFANVNKDPITLPRRLLVSPYQLILLCK